eukprot:10640868-Ditylum_brightwellii.AAC.1
MDENFFTTVYCVKSAEFKKLSDTGIVAVKSLNDMCSDDDTHISRLKNEYTISRHLASQCSSVRSALLLSEFDGFPAIYLQWVAGTTLGKWIKSLHKEGKPSPMTVNSSNIMCKRDIKIILKLASSISMAIAEMHHAGVTHNNLVPSKII